MAQLDVSQTRIKEDTERIASQDQHIEELTTQLNTAHTQFSVSTQELQDCRQKSSKAAELTDQLANTKSELEQAREAAQRDLNSLKETLAQTQSNLEAEQALRCTAEVNLREEKEEHLATKVVLEGREKELANLSSELSTAQTALQDSTLRIDDLSAVVVGRCPLAMRVFQALQPAGLSARLVRSLYTQAPFESIHGRLVHCGADGRETTSLPSSG